MSSRQKRRKVRGWVVVAVILVLGLLLHSLLWAAFITGILYALWLVPARHQVSEPWRPRRPRAGRYIPEEQLTGRAARENTHDYAEKMSRKIS